LADLKIITHTSYTYETTDGREFESRQEAEAWQKAINNGKRIVMLDRKFRATDEIEVAYFVLIKNQEQLEAFNTMQTDGGFACIINEPGYYYYDEVEDDYINVDKEIERLFDIKAKLDNT
jgi:hypothetical protein